MKFKRSDLALYGAALVSAILAIGLVYGYVENRVAVAEGKVEVKTVTVIEKPELRSVLVASRDVYRGEKIEVEDIKVLMVPVEGVIATGVLTEAEVAVGNVAKQNLYAGEWLMEQKIGALDAQASSIEAFIEEGMRIIRIPVSPEAGLLGMLNPSDHVDVIAVFKSADDKQILSRTILQNIEVLSIGQANRVARVSQEQEQEKLNNQQGESFDRVSMVALNVNLQQAEQLALAMKLGTLHLVLRGPADVALVETEGVNVKHMERSKPLVPVYRPKKERDVIQIMQGGNVQEVRTQ